MNTETIKTAAVILLCVFAFAGLMYILVQTYRQSTRSSIPIVDESLGRLYFARSARFDLMDKRIVVTDRSSARLITLDPWYEIVFSAADGQKTIAAFTEELRKGYTSEPPPRLEAEVQQYIRTLKDMGIVALTDSPQSLPYYLQIPSSQQDTEKAKKLMEADGFIKQDKT